jgi:hypothetical protein
VSEYGALRIRAMLLGDSDAYRELMAKMSDQDQLGEAAFHAYVASFAEYVKDDPMRAAIPWEYMTGEMRAPWIKVGTAVAELVQAELRLAPGTPNDPPQLPKE